MLVKYDPEVDLIAVEFQPLPESTEWYGERLDERRYVLRNRAGVALGVELLFASQGVELEGLPEADRIREALNSLKMAAPAS